MFELQNALNVGTVFAGAILAITPPLQAGFTEKVYFPAELHQVVNADVVLTAWGADRGCVFHGKMVSYERTWEIVLPKNEYSNEPVVLPPELEKSLDLSPLLLLLALLALAAEGWLANPLPLKAKLSAGVKIFSKEENAAVR